MRRSSNILVWGLLILVLALGLRIAGLGNQSMWFDEEFTLKIKDIPPSQIFHHTLTKEAKPPLYFYLLHAWTQWGSSGFWLRLPSAILGSLAVLVFFLWLRKERKVSPAFLWAGTVWMALSPMALYYSQEARMYSLMIFLAASFAALACRYLQEGGRGWLIASLSVSVLSCYSYTYGFLIPGFGVVLGALLWLSDPALRLRARALLFSSALGGLSFLPWVLAAIRAAQEQQFLSQGDRSRGSFLEATAYCFYTIGYGVTSGIPMDILRMEKRKAFLQHPWEGLAMIAGLLLLSWVVAWGMVCLWRKHRLLFHMVLAGFAVFYVGPVMIDLLSERIVNNPRYGVMAIPFLALCLGAVVEEWIGSRKPFPSGIALAVFLLLAGLGVWNNYFNPIYQRDDIKGAAAFVQTNPHSPKGVMVCAGNLLSVYEIYDRERPSLYVAVETEDAFPSWQKAIDKFVREHGVVAVVVSRLDYGDRSGKLLPWLESNFEQLDGKKFPGVRVLIVKSKDL